MNKNDLELRKKSPVQIRNKKASFEYNFIDTYTAGIQLTGTEIKSIRMGKASLVDTYCYIVKGEMWVKGMNISPYFYGSYANHEAKREPLSSSMTMAGQRWILHCAVERRCLTSARRSRQRKTGGKWTGQ